MMAHLFCSESYRWANNDVIGKGSEATVYKGRNKETGEWVAVKLYHQRDNLKANEYLILRNIQHKNIVKVLTFENEAVSQSPVLIMELCTSGCLLTHIQRPENFYGLEEQDFLGLLRDTARGWNYLRERNIVHRDFKPNNIMRFLRDSQGGQEVIYKITDFGAARFLQHQESFESIHGTHEYLHPQLFSRWYNPRDPLEKCFDASVDIWSLGATLFHAVTGHLPFEPYEGCRLNPAKHVEIVNKMPSGVISGRQLYKSGPINYSKTLPKECRLSENCKELVEHILANVFALKWQFSEYFSTVQNLLSKVVIHTFVLHSAECDPIYMNSNDGYSLLQNNIRRRFCIDPSIEMKLLLNGEVLQMSSQSMATFPKTTPENPLVILLELNQPFNMIRDPPVVNAHSFQSGDGKRDSKRAKEICADLSRVKRRVETYQIRSDLVKSTTDAVISKLNSSIESLHSAVQRLIDATKSNDTAMHIAHENYMSFHRLVVEVYKVDDGNCSAVLKAMFERVERHRDSLRDLKATLSEISGKVEQIHRKFVVDNYLQQDVRESEPMEQITSYNVGVMTGICSDAVDLLKSFEFREKRRSCQSVPEEISVDQIIDRKVLINLYNKAIDNLRVGEQALGELHEQRKPFFLSLNEDEKKVAFLSDRVQQLERDLSQFATDLATIQKQNGEDVQTNLLPQLKKMFLRKSKNDEKIRRQFVFLAQKLESLNSTTEINQKLLEEVMSQKQNGLSASAARFSSDNISLDSEAASSTAGD
ncbi:uncharacterized protein LOC142336181 [Convolutriloba macropyga]|uniref:uncharacterized protein LOC142336181 n=1 Tax=Convolutriloba macropyga TaxID=536237 RepID=UPI003F51CB7B